MTDNKENWESIRDELIRIRTCMDCDITKSKQKLTILIKDLKEQDVEPHYEKKV